MQGGRWTSGDGKRVWALAGPIQGTGTISLPSIMCSLSRLRRRPRGTAERTAAVLIVRARFQGPTACCKQLPFVAAPNPPCDTWRPPSLQRCQTPSSHSPHVRAPGQALSNGCRTCPREYIPSPPTCHQAAATHAQADASKRTSERVDWAGHWTPVPPGRATRPAPVRSRPSNFSGDDARAGGAA